MFPALPVHGTQTEAAVECHARVFLAEATTSRGYAVRNPGPLFGSYWLEQADGSLDTPGCANISNIDDGGCCARLLIPEEQFSAKPGRRVSAAGFRLYGRDR